MAEMGVGGIVAPVDAGFAVSCALRNALHVAYACGHAAHVVAFAVALAVVGKVHPQAVETHWDVNSYNYF